MPDQATIRQAVEAVLQKSRLQTVETVDLEALAGSDAGSYQVLAGVVTALCREGVLVPVKSSGGNGRTPRLYRRYRKQAPRLDEQEMAKLLTLDPRLKTSYYRSHPAELAEDQSRLEALDRFFKDPVCVQSLNEEITLNERSFQIFKDEKLLGSEVGRELLRRTGLSYRELACFPTPEPFFYVDYRRRGDAGVVPLIVENKDTFHSLRHCAGLGLRRIGDLIVNLLIYGEGHKIEGSFSFYREIPGLAGAMTRCYYFGDLDREGIAIFDSLAARYPEVEITPAIVLYQQLLDRYGHEPPPNREKRQQLHPEALQRFCDYFPSDLGSRIRTLLDSGCYLPQEGLDYSYLREKVCRHG